METPTAPAWSKVFDGFFMPHTLPGGFTVDLLFIILANIGTTIAPWQIFFQQSAVVDKGLDVKDIKFGKWDTLAGATLTCIVAVFIIIATGAAFYYHRPPIVIEDARQTAEALVPLLPRGTGCPGAASCSPSGCSTPASWARSASRCRRSWALGEVFGWAHSLNTSVRDAPWFYLFYLGMLLTAGAVVLIPDAPLVTITMFVQVVAVTLLPSLLVFLL